MFDRKPCGKKQLGEPRHEYKNIKMDLNFQVP